MILEKGVIRTLDPALPRASALAIVGEFVAGGVGTHETALASPERVDLGGRCVLPGFTDSHVHFPTWALAQRQVRLEGTRSLGEALTRVGEAVGSVPEGRWLRGLGWRSGDWSPAVEPTKDDLDAVTGNVPTALMARDYHSLWLNSAALAHANGDLQVPGGVVERDEQGEPTGVLREECAWHFRDVHVRPTHEEMVDASRDGIRLANSRGVVAVHDKDGWLGALAVFQELQREGALTLRVWQSLPHDHVDRLAEIGIASGLGDATSGSATSRRSWTGRSAPRPRACSTAPAWRSRAAAELEDIVRRSARAGFPVAVHAIGNLANREALDAFEATQEDWRPRGLRPRIEHAQLLAAEDVPRFAALGVAASVQFSHASSDRDLADRFWSGLTDGAYAFRSLLDAGTLVANGSDAPIEELDPLAGIARGSPPNDRREAGLAPRAAAHRVRRPSTPPAWHRPGSNGPSECAGGSFPASSPTWSSSTATPSNARRRSFPRSPWLRPWSAGGGCTTRRRGTEGRLRVQ